MTDATLPEQAKHNRPRLGFTHNPYTTALGKLFQETIKGGLERAIGVAWPLLVRYRCNGDKKKARECIRENPDSAFVYDDELFQILDSSLKGTARRWLTDNDAARKQEVVCQTVDLILTLAHEDIYYRALMKEVLADLFLQIAERPELLDLTKDEETIDLIFNRYIRGYTVRKIRNKIFVQAYAEAEERWRAEHGTG